VTKLTFTTDHIKPYPYQTTIVPIKKKESTKGFNTDPN